jgi:hypothetical protein
MKQRGAYARLLFDVDLAFFVATFVSCLECHATIMFNPHDGMPIWVDWQRYAELAAGVATDCRMQMQVKPVVTRTTVLAAASRAHHGTHVENLQFACQPGTL